MQKTAYFVMTMMSIVFASQSIASSCGCDVAEKNRAIHQEASQPLPPENYTRKYLLQANRATPEIERKQVTEPVKYQRPRHVHHARVKEDRQPQQQQRVQYIDNPRAADTRVIRHPEMLTHEDTIGYFKNISVDGRTTLYINNGTPPNTIRMVTKGVCPTRLIDYGINNNTLIISRFEKRNWDSEAQQPVYVYINAANIGDLTVSRGASIVSRDLRGNNMTIRTRDSGNINLRGTFCVRRISTEGFGNLNIEWIDTDEVEIVQAGSSEIHMAGIANIVNVRAIDSSYADLEFLRAKNVVAQTSDCAIVKVTAIYDLAGFAGDYSNILYSKTPTHMNRYNYGSGNVMQMHYWN